MKVLFAFNDEKAVDSLAEFYKKTYDEKLEVTKVYFFRSLIETLKKNKNFDRIVIHEEVEAFGSKNQDAIDKYLFNNIDKASDESGKADIILVCTERRQYNDKFIKNLFNLGIYNILCGQDRTFGKVSELINRPRTKKDAKMLIDVDLEENPYESSDKIDELELRNIVRYYEKNIFSKDKIVSGFDSLYEQYTFEKLKQIVPFLPIKAREVLEQESQKYIALMSYKPQKGGRGEKVKVVEVPVYIKQEEPKKLDKSHTHIKLEEKNEEADKIPAYAQQEQPRKFDNSSAYRFEPKAEQPRAEQPRVEQPRVETPRAEVSKAEQPKIETPKVEVPKVEEIRRSEPTVQKFDENINISRNIVEPEMRRTEPTVQKFEEMFKVPKVEVPPTIEISNKIAEEEKRKAEELARKQAEEEARKAEELAKKQAEEEAKKQAEELAKKQAEEEAKKQAEELAKKQAEEEAKKQAEELAKKQAEEEAKKQAEELARKQAEEEKRKAEELARKQAEEEAKKQAEELARKQAEEERKRAEELAKKQAEEEVRKVEEMARKKAEEEAKKQAEELKKNEEPQIIRPEIIKPQEEPQIVRPTKPAYTPSTQPPRYQPPRPMPDEPRIQTVTQVIEKEVIKEVYDTPRDYKKAVCFIGAHKTGTTFIINALASVLAGKGVKVAILDLTRNKDSYLIYTNRDLDQKDIAANSLNNLAIGHDRPFKLGNLSIYTGIPRTSKNNIDVYKAIEIAKRENSVVLIDCDFTTKKDVPDVFRYVQSIYVVQDMDTLNILPITMFLKELKNADVDPNKIAVIINKYMKSSLKVDDILGSLAFYTSPDFSVMEEDLLPKNPKRFIVPFDEQNYLRYIENVSSCKMNFSGFSEDFKQAISIIIQDVFPIGTRPMPKQSDEGGFLKNLFGKR